MATFSRHPSLCSCNPSAILWENCFIAVGTNCSWVNSPWPRWKPGAKLGSESWNSNSQATASIAQIQAKKTEKWERWTLKKLTEADPSPYKLLGISKLVQGEKFKGCHTNYCNCCVKCSPMSTCKYTVELFWDWNILSTKGKCWNGGKRILIEL